MNSLILSAGYGKRLNPITLTKPKCLIKIKGKPIISIWIENLIKINTKKIFVNTHYQHKQVESYLKKKKLNTKLKILYEPTLLGTAGTLIKNMKYFLNSNLLLAHCDNYFLESLNKIISFHNNRPKKYLMTMVAFKTRKPETCGIIKEKNNSIIDYFLGNLYFLPFAVFLRFFLIYLEKVVTVNLQINIIRLNNILK